MTLAVPPHRHHEPMAERHSDARTDVPPAAADLWCWLHAAFPLTGDGRLDVDRVADALDVSPDTVARWATDRYFEPGPVAASDHEVRQLAAEHGVSMAAVRRWLEEDDLDDDQWATLRRRAVLRGRGHPLWPRLDAPVLARQDRARRNAAQSWHTAATTPTGQLPAAWRSQGWLEPHQVLVAHHRSAWVNRVTLTRAASGRSARTLAGAELVDQVEVPNRFAAVATLHAVLAHVDPWRALPPRELLPAGRTEAWRDVAPPVELAAITAATLDELAGA
jgi:hypothetical protein